MLKYRKRTCIYWPELEYPRCGYSGHRRSLKAPPEKTFIAPAVSVQLPHLSPTLPIHQATSLTSGWKSGLSHPHKRISYMTLYTIKHLKPNPIPLFVLIICIWSCASRFLSGCIPSKKPRNGKTVIIKPVWTTFEKSCIIIRLETYHSRGLD